MDKTLTTLYNYFKPYYFYITVAVILLIVIAVAYYGYKKYAKHEIDGKKYNDVANANVRKIEANIYFFHVDWCPHCVKAKPEWDKFAQAYENKVINNYIVKIHSMDCTGDIDGNTESISQKYNISSYPTVKLIIDGEKPIELDSKITQNTLGLFVNEILESQ
jgi:thiol-disulfide isomerase/thioredoxin